MVDLHSHSTASDGSLTPTQLVELAAERGLKALALTDHDTLDGLAEAAAAASRLAAAALEAAPPTANAAAAPRLIPGIEIEIAFEPGEFHLLGLGIARPGAELVDAAARLSRARVERNRRILERARAAGIDVTMDDLAEAAGGGVAGRPHIAALLVSRKAVRTRQEAFDRYLGKGRPWYEAKDCLELTEAIRLVKESGALAIAAHPLSLFVSWGRLASIMDEWKELGIDGIEAYHPAAKVGQCRRLERMARERGFLVTAGSDFHGSLRPERKLGKTAGNLEIDDSYLEALGI
jgi:3',5'-nucleoside bisphosphate phosphatase